MCYCAYFVQDIVPLQRPFLAGCSISVLAPVCDVVITIFVNLLSSSIFSSVPTSFVFSPSPARFEFTKGLYFLGAHSKEKRGFNWDIHCTS
ncbi:hypothetical protein K457DRAFT_141984 [Linnemannia elongata AG-77]|uniref:Uncharacterized protein n=1 Tax=Linnemannia elongata AG-77 TaxID=1314771 RepID=A0A197JJ35_9FUNG|nr:hypothetical protein K457DRAFT_141984 [Linnemannia elongata AG-77]